MPTRREALYSVRIVPLSFLVAIIVGTVLLALPDAATGPGSAPLLTAFFTATSAVCVTGLTTVDTQTYWSGFGQAVIMGLFQIGGLGVMTLAALLSLVVYRRLGLGTRLAAESETRTVDLSELRGLFIRLAGIVLAVEGIASAILAARFWISYGLS
ncbi:MAG: potassium transporter TrkG, partial [Micromonosporaceae bacterium]